MGELAREEGDWATSILEHGKVLEYDPQNSFVLQALARTHMHAGNLALARATLERLRVGDRRSFRARALECLLFALEGNREQAAQSLNSDLLKYLALNVFDTVIAAEIYASLGDEAKALEWLDKAARNGDERGEWFMRNPALATLRSSPAFQGVISSIVGRRVQ